MNIKLNTDGDMKWDAASTSSRRMGSNYTLENKIKAAIKYEPEYRASKLINLSIGLYLLIGIIVFFWFNAFLSSNKEVIHTLTELIRLNGLRKYHLTELGRRSWSNHLIEINLMKNGRHDGEPFFIKSYKDFNFAKIQSEMGTLKKINDDIKLKTSMLDESYIQELSIQVDLISTMEKSTNPNDKKVT